MGMESRLPILVMETDVAAVVANGAVPGWVSGTIASLALSASFTVVFDLGPNWAQYTLINIGVNPAGPSTGLVSVESGGSDTVVFNSARRQKDIMQAGFASAFASITVASGPANAFFRSSGRFFIVRGANGDGVNAMGAASKINLTAYPS